jgi:hypothetical protein
MLRKQSKPRRLAVNYKQGSLTVPSHLFYLEPREMVHFRDIIVQKKERFENNGHMGLENMCIYANKFKFG